jgi:hypothetical protein
MTFTDPLTTPSSPSADAAGTRSVAGPGSLQRTARSVPPRAAADAQLPLRRLHLMRFGYLVLGVGTAVFRWPTLIDHGADLPLMEGVVTCILVAMSLLAFLGLRYPVRMLPLLVLESAWKLLWLSVVALPQLIAGDMGAATREVMNNCLWVVIFLVVVPWRHVWRQFATAEGDRWR